MYGLLGEKLGHSFSPQIHSMLGDYDYELFEVEKEKLSDFLKNGKWDGINVTIPYKKAVMPYLDEASPQASEIGSVNTIIRRKDGTLYGDNTDYYGFYYLVLKSGIKLEGKKVLVLGTGGASLAVNAVLRDMKVGEIVSISRNGENNYENISKHSDAEVIVNTTPVGMYPQNLNSPVKLNGFTHLVGVLDIIYNPQKTKLVLDAEKLGITAVSGLTMLVAQAKRASEIFFDKSINDSKIDEICNKLSMNMKNIVLIGMPGCGKTTVGKALAKKLSREIIDTDSEIVEREKRSIPDIFKSSGEGYFRGVETEVLTDCCKLSGKLISTGGGIVCIDDNFDIVKQNSVVIFINRDISALPTHGRPLSQANDLSVMYQKRLPLYRSFCDIEIDGNGTVDEVADRVMKGLEL